MTPARKTSAILVLACAVAAGALMLTKARAGSKIITPTTGGAAFGVQVSANLESSHVLFGTSTTHLAVTVRAPEVDGATRRPDLNLAIVLDRSGSMNGEKLDHAKAAARELVNNLSEGDRFSITVYGSEVDVVFPSARASNQAKAAAITTIDAIYDDGGTNLSGGLLAGRSQLLGNVESGAVSRVVLISDGQANEGIVNEQDLAKLAETTAQMGVSLTTVGVGLDFDEKVMTSLAVAGRGNYYFAESSHQLAELFNREFERVGATAATDVTLSIQAAPGVVIADAFGYRTRREGNRTLISIADLTSGETRKVVLRLDVAANATGSMDIADIDVAFQPVGKSDIEHVTFASRAEVTCNRTSVLNNRNGQAIRHIERARTANAINQATVLYEAGDVAAAQAVIEQRETESSAIAADMADEELDAELKGFSSKSKANFAAKPSSSGGKKGRKSNRRDAYKLMY
jgi:Ca-activated chloride channel family protein